MGAWIEMEAEGDTACSRWSLPTWERGLKFPAMPDIIFCHFVAPYMGAWIEISLCARTSVGIFVAPYMGAWIEITEDGGYTAVCAGRSLHGSVD